MIIYPDLNKMKDKLWKIFLKKYNDIIENSIHYNEKIYCNLSLFPESKLKVRILSSKQIRVAQSVEKVKMVCDRIEEKNKEMLNSLDKDPNMMNEFNNRSKKKNRKYPTQKQVNSVKQEGEADNNDIPQEKIGFLDFNSDVIKLAGTSGSIIGLPNSIILSDAKDIIEGTEILDNEKLTNQNVILKNEISENESIISNLKEKINNLEVQAFKEIKRSNNFNLNAITKDMMNREFKEESNKSPVIECKNKLSVSETRFCNIIEEIKTPIKEEDPSKDILMLQCEQIFELRKRNFIKIFKKSFNSLQAVVFKGDRPIDVSNITSYKDCLEQLGRLTNVLSEMNASYLRSLEE